MSQVCVPSPQSIPVNLTCWPQTMAFVGSPSKSKKITYNNRDEVEISEVLFGGTMCQMCEICKIYVRYAY